MSVNTSRRRFVKGSAGALLATAAGNATVAAGMEGDSSAQATQPEKSIDLWPAGPPGMPDRPPQETLIERSTDAAIPDRALTGISRPRVDVFRPAAPNGAAVIIFPGGGYQRVVVDKEGYELGRWLAARGVTAFVLFYRLPGDGWEAGPNVAFSDAQRAMRIVRHRAAEFGVESARVAALGFSAGGHLCADLATRFAAETYAQVDEADANSARPMLAAPIYPVISMSLPVAHAGSRDRLLGPRADREVERRYSPQHNVSDETPPCFLVHAEDDDAVPVANTLEFRAALRTQGIPVETHLFAYGGHGFGLRRAAGKPAHIWPELFVNWARSFGLLSG
jgi:acetyl esterase/lipase